MINLNQMDVAIALEEGKAVQLPIGQVKEVRRLALEFLASRTPVEVVNLLARVAGKMDCSAEAWVQPNTGWEG